MYRISPIVHPAVAAAQDCIVIENQYTNPDCRGKNVSNACALHKINK